MDKGLERIKQLLTDLGLLDINGNASGVSATAIQAVYDAITNAGLTPSVAVDAEDAFGILLAQYLAAVGLSSVALSALYNAIVDAGRTPAVAITADDAFGTLLNQFLTLANRDIRTDDQTNNGAASISLSPSSLGKYAYIDIDSNVEISLDPTGSEFGDEFHLECNLTGSGGWTVTWGTGISATSAAAVAPTFTGDRTIVSFLRMHSDGTNDQWTMIAAKEVTI